MERDKPNFASILGNEPGKGDNLLFYHGLDETVKELARVFDTLVVWVEEVWRFDVVVYLEFVSRLEAEQNQTRLTEVFDSGHFFLGELDFLLSERDEVADVFVVQLGVVFDADELVYGLDDFVVLGVQVHACRQLDLVDESVA